jgi:alpha-ketoglutarate-dependent taurine dioxygenase
MATTLASHALDLGKIDLPLGTYIPTLDLRGLRRGGTLTDAEFGRAIFNVVNQEGALLIKSVMREAADLSAFLSSIGHKPFSSYVGGTAIRSAPVAENVFKSTELPPDVTIPLHQEMAYVAVIPDYISLFCSSAASGDQKTNLVGDMVKFTQTLPDWVFQKYRGRTARLRRFMPPRGIDHGMFRLRRCWNDMIGTSDRDEARAIAAERNWALRWTEDDFLEVLQEPFPFFRQHPIHGEIWCTQAFAYLPVIQSYLAKMDGRVDDWNRMQAAMIEAPETLDTAVLDDGSPLDDDDALFIHKRLEGQTFRMALREGELLILDNILRSHGRSPFHGTRKIFVALGVRH